MRIWRCQFPFTVTFSPLNLIKFTVSDGKVWLIVIVVSAYFDCGLRLIVAQGLLILGEFGSLSLVAFLEYLFTQLRNRSQLRSPTILYSDLKLLT